MSDLRTALKNAGLLESVEAAAERLGTDLEGALKQAFLVEPVVKPQPGTVEFYEVVCDSLSAPVKKSYCDWKAAAEALVCRECSPAEVMLYAYCGKSVAQASIAETAVVEEAVDNALGQ